jgi:hypothetical protein
VTGLKFTGLAIFCIPGLKIQIRWISKQWFTYYQLVGFSWTYRLGISCLSLHLCSLSWFNFENILIGTLFSYDEYAFGLEITRISRSF